MAYSSVTLVEQKTGTTLSVDQRSYMEAVVLPAIDAWINGYIGVFGAFASEPDTEGEVIFSGNGTNIALLPQLVTITNLHERDVEDAREEIDISSWYMTEPGVVRLYTGKFQEGIANYVAEGILAEAPASLVLAATEMASNVITNTGTGALQSEKIGDWQKVYATAGAASYANDSVLIYLQPYKAIRVA